MQISPDKCIGQSLSTVQICGGWVPSDVGLSTGFCVGAGPGTGFVVGLATGGLDEVWYGISAFTDEKVSGTMPMERSGAEGLESLQIVFVPIPYKYSSTESKLVSASSWRDEVQDPVVPVRRRFPLSSSWVDLSRFWASENET